MAEEVVLRAGLGVNMAQVDTGANGGIRHPAILTPIFECDDRAMPDQEEATKVARADDPETDPETDPDTDEELSDPTFTIYGIASAVLGVVSIVAIVLGVLIYQARQQDSGERIYLTKVMQAAAEWTNVLINMNASNVNPSLQKLRDGTVGQLNTDFDAAVQPYRQVVEKLQTQSVGRIEAVAVESVHHDLDSQPGVARQVVTTKLPAFASRADSVMVVATSVAENAGAKPQTVHWNLRLEVSDIEGKLMISKLESIK
ncbi:hypothetical protein MBOU_61410 [Mycobacterium bourgelatii]|uniref:Mce associated membrane protein n=2 Tax=Mycobacterium bourgelatii TaxID=1273442 RepID=A0A7I9YZF1_MYCBU|nr:hypothetical protein MBOU_61410 [Mycobacterium bourgelatii]